MVLNYNYYLLYAVIGILFKERYNCIIMLILKSHKYVHSNENSSPYT